MTSAFSAPKNKPAPTSKKSPTITLKRLAKERGLLVGAAVAVPELFEDPVYEKFIRNEFSIFTPENAFKFDALRPSRDAFSFETPDKMVHFARLNRMLMRGHTLVWHNPAALPNWFLKGKFSAKEKREILKDHIQKTLTHFKKAAKGAIICWDVANEVFHHDGSYRTDSIWAPVAAPTANAFLTQVFNWAHETDPKLKLFYNDYDIELPGPKATAVYNTLKALKKAGVPVHGIGFQMHQGPDRITDLKAIRANMRRFAALGLQIHITEFDFKLKDSEPKESALEKQALAYADAINLCKSIKACKAFVSWGITDKYTYVSRDNSGMGRANMLDFELLPKPAYYALRSALSKKADRRD